MSILFVRRIKYYTSTCSSLIFHLLLLILIILILSIAVIFLAVALLILLTRVTCTLLTCSTRRLPCRESSTLGGGGGDGIGCKYASRSL